MNLASTYLMALAAILLLLGVGFLVHLCFFKEERHKQIFTSFRMFLYVFFISGVVVASCASIQGASLNSISSPTLNSVFYILGICLYIAIVLEIGFSFLFRH